MEKQVTILRGVSGSGKTSFAEFLKSLSPNETLICCADDYFMKDGRYLWNAEELYKAHNWCFAKFVAGLKDEEIRHIIIANTSATKKEVDKYRKCATNEGVRVACLVVENRHEGKNIHNVTEETLQKQKERLKNNIEL